MGLLHRFLMRQSPAVWATEVRLLTRLGLARPPVAVQWLATSACDLTCPHCYVDAGPCGPQELTTAEVRRFVIDELVHMGCDQLVVAGGEPLLRPDLDQIIDYACGRGLNWSLQTHGGHVGKWLDLLRRHPPMLAAVSLDGPREYHGAFRGRAGSFDRALEALRLLKDAGCPEVVAGTTVTRGNADLLLDLLPIVMESAADSWGLHLVIPEGRCAAAAEELLPTPDQLRRAAAFVARKRSVFRIEMDDEWGSAGADDPFYRSQPFHCGAGRFTCVVNAAGEVLPCTTSDLAESQGNVRQRSLSRIWTEGFSRFRRGGVHGHDCVGGQDCWLQARNGHRCRQQTFTPLTLGATS